MHEIRRPLSACEHDSNNTSNINFTKSVGGAFEGGDPYPRKTPAHRPPNAVEGDRRGAKAVEGGWQIYIYIYIYIYTHIYIEIYI